jgi:hypothetical protein
VTVKGGFKHVLTFSADPGSWYNSSALGAAYHTQDNTLWQHGTPSWDSTFGSKGNMLWFTSSLVVADGIDMTIHSEAALSTEEQTEIKANLSVGIWPFFSLGSSGGYTHDVSYSSSGAATIHISNPAGNPVVLGGNVEPVASYLSSGGRMRFVPHSAAATAPAGAFVITRIMPGDTMTWPGRAQGYVVRIYKAGWQQVVYVVRDARGATIAAGRVDPFVIDSGDIAVHPNTAFTVYNVGVAPLAVRHP